VKEIPEKVVNLATVLANIFKGRPEETRPYLKNPEFWITESGARKHSPGAPEAAISYLAAELARIHFGQAVRNEPKARMDFWLQNAEDLSALGLQ